MPFPMKIQPLDSRAFRESIRNDSTKPVLKSRLKRLFLFDRQSSSVLRISSAERAPASETQNGKDGAAEFEPSSVCLDKLVQNFIEESNEKQSVVKYGRNSCNCFNGNNNDSSDDELDFFTSFGDSIPSASSGDSIDLLKSLIPCASVAERNLLADTSMIMEKNKTCKRKDDLRKFVTDGLLLLDYDASICKSLWEKSPSYPAGEYEYIDVIVEGERVLIDIDFRSEFEIARPTGSYRAILQSLPHIFVARADRLQQIVSIVSEAARQSLKKKGLHLPPWRKAEYVKAKWLSPHSRSTVAPLEDDAAVEETQTPADNMPFGEPTETEADEWELIFGETEASPVDKNSGEEEKIAAMGPTWQPPVVKLKSCEGGAKVVTGLASLLREKP